MNNIRNVRRDKGLTLRAVAAKVGISVPYLSDIERGFRHGSFSTLEKIADALGVEVSELTEREVG